MTYLETVRLDNVDIGDVVRIGVSPDQRFTVQRQDGEQFELVNASGILASTFADAIRFFDGMPVLWREVFDRNEADSELVSVNELRTEDRFSIDPTDIGPYIVTDVSDTGINYRDEKTGLDHYLDKALQELLQSLFGQPIQSVVRSLPVPTAEPAL